MLISLVVAASQNDIIGRDNQLPWHLPNDLKFFKQITMGKPIIMGRLTWDSIGRPLPGRTNIVITRDTSLQIEGVKVVNSKEQAIAEAEKEGVDEMMVIGGEGIYRLFMEDVDRIYLTRVHAEIEGDAHFPAFDEKDWRLISAEDHKACDKNPYDYSFLVFERKPG